MVESHRTGRPEDRRASTFSLARLMYSPGASSRHVGLVGVGAAQAPGFYLPGDFCVQLGLRTTAPEPGSAGGARGRA